MSTNMNIKKLLVIALIIFTFTPVSLVSTSANASMVQSSMVTEDGETLTPREIDEIKVKRALEHKLVKERLHNSGLSKQQVVEKMDKMSDEEVHQIASLSEKVPAGGNGAVGAVVGVLVIIILVLLIIYLIDRV